MLDDTDRWWNLDGPVVLNGQGDMLYAVLGPVLTRHLLTLLDEAVASGFDLTPELRRVQDDLAWADGRSPWLLYQLGLALASFLVSTDTYAFTDVGSDLVQMAESRRYEILKAAGWFIAERLRSFGFDEATFALNASGHDGWPPRGVACGRAAPAVQSMAPRHESQPVAAAAHGDASELSTEERCLLLDHVPLPEWVNGFDVTTRRLMALIQSAVDGRRWAQPFVRWSGDHHAVVSFVAELWAIALGVETEAATASALKIDREMLFGPRGMNWQFDT